MADLKKILYITDQQEYSEDGTISSLFDIYLQKYFEVNIVFLTKYKSSFQEKGTHLIVPNDKRAYIVEYLESKGIDISAFSFVFVRNKKDTLKNVLKNKERFSYKVVYRISYPKKHHKIDLMNKFSPFDFVKSMMYKNKIQERDRLVNQCDLFLHPSPQAKAKFYPNITIEDYPIFVGLDPDKLNEHICLNDDVRKFIYVGTIDEMREFNVILSAFDALKSDKWKLTITTTKKEYILQLLNSYPRIRSRIELISAMSLQILGEQINENDVGIALLPRNDFYDTVIADKVINYYGCSIPALMTSNEKNHSIFAADEAYFCDFEKSKIVQKLQELIDTPNKELGLIGNKGQEKLLSLKRNYKLLAKDLADKLNSL